jgi:hypothetical protein
MSQVQFLLDENMPRALAAALRRREPTLDVRRVGQSDMPSIGTNDPDLLRFCQQSERLLVSRDKSSMPQHVADHVAQGGHTPGVLLATNRCTLGSLAEDLLLIWSATSSSEWQVVIAYLPLTD